MADSDFVPGYDTCNKVTPQCPIEATLYGEYFSKPPVAFFAAAFGLLLLYQIWSAFKLRAWGFSIWLCLGTIFETVGYISRVEMADNPWKKDAFQKQLVLLIVGPRLIAAAIAITFKHLVLYYNPSLSILRPRWYPFVFVGTDIIAIILQGAGAVLAGQGHDLADVSTGLLIGGVSFQLVDMLECGLLMVVYWRVRWFVWAIIAAYILIIVRCVYRYAQRFVYLHSFHKLTSLGFRKWRWDGAAL